MEQSEISFPVIFWKSICLSKQLGVNRSHYLYGAILRIISCGCFFGECSKFVYFVQRSCQVLYTTCLDVRLSL